LVRFSGVVKNSARAIPAEGVSLTFTIYEVQQGGTPLWTETQNVLLNQNCGYTVLLGANSGTGLPLEIFTSGQALWLDVQTELPGLGEQTRVLLVAVPYALKAADADTLGGKPASAFVTAGSHTGSSGAGTSVFNEDLRAGAALEQAQSQATLLAVGGTGSTNFIPIWANSSTLGNSTIFETGGVVGIGNTTPAATLDVKGASGKFSAVTVLRATGGSGGNLPLGQIGSAGTGGGLQLTSGIGGQPVLRRWAAGVLRS
jgi:hypothetical protein